MLLTQPPISAIAAEKYRAKDGRLFWKGHEIMRNPTGITLGDVNRLFDEPCEPNIVRKCKFWVMGPLKGDGTDEHDFTRLMPDDICPDCTEKDAMLLNIRHLWYVLPPGCLSTC